MYFLAAGQRGYALGDPGRVTDGQIVWWTVHALDNKVIEWNQERK